MVRKNLRGLSAMRKRLGLNATVYVAVKWLDYKTNSGEAAAMEELARSLGFDFLREAARYLSWDRLIACLDGREHPYEGSERLIHPPAAAVVSPAGACRRLASGEDGRGLRCFYQERELCIRCTGDVYVCCWMPYREEYRLGNYLTDPVEKLQKGIREHRICGECMRLNLHRLLS
jgi:hypothetical protein